MTAVEEVEVIIRPDGTVEIRVRGVDGKACREITAEIERYLGGRITHREHTDEYVVRTDRQRQVDRNRLT